jgi:addiction module RelE/StbE family toxin
MKILYSKSFKKLYRKLPKKVQRAFDERIILMLESPKHPLLSIHRLHGKYVGAYSMNVAGDMRALFEKIDTKTIEFFAIGSHSELYS